MDHRQSGHLVRHEVRRSRHSGQTRCLRQDGLARLAMRGPVIGHHVDPFGWRHCPPVGDVTGLATASPATGQRWRIEGCAHSVPGQRGQSVRRKKLRVRRLASRRGMLVGVHLVKRSRCSAGSCHHECRSCVGGSAFSAHPSDSHEAWKAYLIVRAVKACQTVGLARRSSSCAFLLGLPEDP